MNAPVMVKNTIDWPRSAGLFIGIEDFHPGTGPDPVLFAVDDAIDLAYFFTKEQKTKLLLSPARTVLISGRPHT